MRIRTQIFSWVFLATIVPLTALVLAATYYVEYDYEQSVRESVATSLDTLGGELKRRLQANRDLAMGLARANAVREFVPLISRLDKGETDPMFNVYRSRITHYFAGFQTILQGMYIMRLMDSYGNSYIKVSNSKNSAPVYEGFGGVMFAEQEADGPRFRKRLKTLPRDDVSVTVPVSGPLSGAGVDVGEVVLPGRP